MSAYPRPFQVPASIDATRVSRRLYVGSVPPMGPHLQEYRAMGRAWKRGSVDQDYPGLLVYCAPLDDDPTKLGQPSESELWLANDVAAQVAALILRGRRALFTCMQGRNRSAFVAALTLHRLTGRSGNDCAERVRSIRSEATGTTVLINPWFCQTLAGLREKKSAPALAMRDLVMKGVRSNA